MSAVVRTEEAIIGRSLAASAPDLRVRAIGRQSELAALGDELDRVTQGSGRTVAVVGPAGIGKTMLLRSFLRGASRATPVVASAECLALEAAQPLAPFVQLLRVLEPLSPATREAAEQVRSSLGALAKSGDAVRSQLFLRFAHLVDVAAASDLVIVAIDDLQWADQSSLDLVVYLARKIVDRPVLILCGVRMHEPAATPALESVLAELARRAPTTRIELRPFTHDETSSFVRACLRLESGPDHEFVSRLLTRTQGNPLHVDEVMRAMVDGGLVYWRAGTWYRSEALSDEVVPASVANSVRARLAAMEATTSRILRAAAVLGPLFTFEALASMCRLGRDDVIAAIRNGIQSGLLEEERQPERYQYRFRHALLRDALEATLIGPERAELHAAAASVLEGHAGHAELAHHYDAAGERAQSARHHLAAAIVALRASSFDAALSHSERAVHLAEAGSLPGDDFMELVPMWYHHAEPSRALRFAEDLLRSYDSATGGLYRGRVLTFRGLVYDRLGDAAGTRESCASAVSELESLGDSPHLARALANHAHFMDQPDVAITLADRAVAVARRTGDLGAFLHAASARGGRLILIGRFAEGVAQNDEADGRLRQAMKASDTPDPGALISLGVIHANLRGAPGIRPRRTAMREEVIALARAADLRTPQAILAEEAVALERGDWDESLRLSEELQSFRGGTPSVAADDLRQALMHVLRHGPDRARTVFDTDRREAASARGESAVIRAGWSAAIALAVGDPQLALRYATPALGAIATISNGLPIGMHAVPAGICGITAARLAADRRAFATWTATTQEGAALPLAAATLAAFADAERAIEMGDPRRGAERFRQCAEWLADLEFLFAEHLVRLRRIEVLAISGDTASAQAELDPLLAYWRAAKAEWYLGRLREQLRPLGLEVGPTRPTVTRSRGAMTRREREVAALVAQGLTNREIAERLGVSARTVESHVERIRMKLGFSTRAQIAALIGQRTRE